MNKPTIFPDDLAAMAKINEGLRMLQEAKANAPQSAPGTVSDQLAQQGIAALQGTQAPQEQPEEMGQAVQTSAPQTPTGQMAMQANVGAQIQQQQQQQQQQQGQQAAMQLAQQQKPQGMAHGGIAALRSDNMRHFKEGGVLGFKGDNEEASYIDTGELFSLPKKQTPEQREMMERVRKAQKENDPELLKSIELVQKRNKESALVNGKLPLSMTAPDVLKPSNDANLYKFALEKIEARKAEEAAAAAKNVPVAAPPQPSGIEQLALSSIADSPQYKEYLNSKQSALDEVNKTILPKAQNMEQIKSEREAEAKVRGIDLYGEEQKKGIQSLQDEFSKQEAARNELNKGRGMDNLITMLTNTKGSPSFFGSLARGVNVSQAEEKLQRAEDAAFGTKKLEFMDSMNTKRALLNERNVAVLNGDLNKIKEVDEQIRQVQNGMINARAGLFKAAMSDESQQATNALTNQTHLQIARAQQAASQQAHKDAQDARDFAGVEQAQKNVVQARDVAIQHTDANFEKSADGMLLKTFQMSGGMQNGSAEEKAQIKKILAKQQAERDRIEQTYQQNIIPIQARMQALFGQKYNLPTPISPNNPSWGTVSERK